MERKNNLGVAWSLPYPKGKGFKKLPFIYSTLAVSYSIRVLGEDGHTFKSVLDLDGYLIEEKEICKAFVDAGYGEVLIKDWVH